MAVPRSSLAATPSTDAERILWGALGAMETAERIAKQIERDIAVIKGAEYVSAAKTLGISLPDLLAECEALTKVFNHAKRADCNPPAEPVAVPKAATGKASKANERTRSSDE